MERVNCAACNVLRSDVPEFVRKGVTDDMCMSLANNTGLDSTLGKTDEEDLHNINDCLVGMMGKKVDSYADCDWKVFAKRIIPNIWTTIKAVICSIGGLWSHVEALEQEQGVTCDTIWDVLQVALNSADLVAGTIRTAKLTDTSADQTAKVFMHVKTREGDLCGDHLVYDLVGTWISASWVASNLAVGDVIATWDKSQIVPAYMHEPIWNAIMTDGFLQTLCIASTNTLVYVVLQENASYPDKMSMTVHSIIGSTYANGPLATIQNPVKTFVI